MNESGYTPKDLHFDQEARERLISGIEKIAKAVKSTMGPMGKTVIIESPNHTHGITVTKDGVTVAKAVALLDPIENLAVKMVREAADRTALSSGDGTTTAIVLTEAIVMEGLKMIEPHHNVSEVIRCINRECEKVIEKLNEHSISINEKRLKDVATISANNDPDIGSIIHDTYKKVGMKDGIVTVEKSQTTETSSDVTDGIKIDRGYTSPLFINNHKKDECVFDNVDILVTDSSIDNLEKIAPVLNACITEGRKLLIIALDSVSTS
jgi:chaperonin GroEL